MYDNLYLHGFEDSEAVSAAAGAGIPRGQTHTPPSRLCIRRSRSEPPEILLCYVICGGAAVFRGPGGACCRSPWLRFRSRGQRRLLPRAGRFVSAAGEPLMNAVLGVCAAQQQPKLLGCHLHGAGPGQPVTAGAFRVESRSGGASEAPPTRQCLCLPKEAGTGWRRSLGNYFSTIPPPSPLQPEQPRWGACDIPHKMVLLQRGGPVTAGAARRPK